MKIKQNYTVIRFVVQRNACKVGSINIKTSEDSCDQNLLSVIQPLEAGGIIAKSPSLHENHGNVVIIEKLLRELVGTQAKF